MSQDEDQTQIVTTTRSLVAAPDERVHFLEVVDGAEPGQRHLIGPAGASLGRLAPCDIILPDSEVSRSHCRLDLKGDDLVVTDLESTNGAYVNGARIREPTILPIGGTLGVGRQALKHEWRTRGEIARTARLDRDLEKANSYVQALLPARVTSGPIRTDWLYLPCAKLGGDAFGYGQIGPTQFAAYLVDVSGHGAGAAMHSVTVMNLLRQRAVPGADMAQPAQVLTALNAMFQMEDHADMYFTMWYGVYDTATRRLTFATAGHHPGYMTAPDRAEAVPLRTRNSLIGAVPTATYTDDAIDVPPGASVYLFSDGVFEIVTNGGVQWSLQDFLPLILKPPINGVSECQRLFQEVNGVARPGGFDDDFSLVVVTFD